MFSNALCVADVGLQTMILIFVFVTSLSRIFQLKFYS